MKLLTILTLVLALSLVAGYPRKHRKDNNGGKRMSHRHATKKELKKSARHENGKKKEHHSTTKGAHKVFKKFGMFAAPSFGLEDSSAGQPQEQQAIQQVLMPMSSAAFTQSQATAPQIVSSFSSTSPSQRATLGTEVVGDQSSTQSQPMAAQSLQGAQQPQILQYEGAPGGTNEENSVLKTQTQGATLQAQEPEPNTAQIVQSAAGGLETDAQDIQSFTQQDSGKSTGDAMKNLQFYNGPLPDSGQQKPQIEGVSPQEEVKIVNLGDDEKTVTLQQGSDKACGGCPSGAKCVSGQCQIREEEAQAQSFTGKGSPSNPGTISDIHSLETQELASLLKDASSADSAPTSVTQSPTASSTAEFAAQGQTQLQEQLPHTARQQQKAQTQPKPAQEIAPPQQLVQKAATSAQAHFTSNQLKELRDFARMYKMYQFIRKMEERLNDPDCAPVCRRKCKRFCPAKCCHGQKVNTSVVSNLMKSVTKVHENKPKVSSFVKQQKAQEDMMEGKDADDNEEQEEKKMDNDAVGGKKHILIRIVKNDVLDKPRSSINRETV